MRLRRLAFRVALLAVPATGALAQDALPQVDNKRRTDVSVSVTTIYDTNVARAGDVPALRRGVRQEDTVFRPAITLDLIQPLGRQAVFVRGSAGYDFYRRNTQLDRRRADLTAGYTIQLGICQPTAFAGYRAFQSEFETSDVGVVKNLVEATSLAAGLQCGRGLGPGLMVVGRREDTKNSAKIQEEVDTTTKNLTVQLSYNNPALARVGVVYVYADNQFPNRIIPTLPVGDGFITTTYGLSLGRDIGARLSLDGVLSRTVVKREFAPPGLPQKFESNTYEGNLTYRVSSRLDLQGHASRAVRPSSQVGKLYDIVTEGEVAAAYKLGSRYTITLGGIVRDLDSASDALVRPVITDARSYIAYGSVGYRTSRGVRLLLDVRQEDRTTNLPDFNYIANRVGLTAQMAF